MAETQLVNEIMVPLARYPHLPGQTPLCSAIAVIRKGLDEAELSAFRRALVLDADGGLLGVLSMAALLKGLAPRSLKVAPDAGKGYAPAQDPESGLAMELFWEQLLSGANAPDSSLTAAELVEPPAAVVAPETRVSQALCRMLALDLPMLPVVDNGRAVGVLRLVDVFDRVSAMVRECRL